MMADQTPEPAPQEQTPPDDQELKDLLKDLASEPPEAVEAEVIPEAQPPAPMQDMTPAKTPQEQQQLAEFAKKFTDVANEILANYRSDRDQINDTIEFLENLVFNSTGQRVHVEMLVAAERTKSDTTATAVKLLDSYAKFLAATKGTNVFVQNNNTTIQEDLAQILAKAPYLDEVKNAKNK